MDASQVLMTLLTSAGLVPVVGAFISLIEEIRPLNKGEKRIVAVVTTAVISFVVYALAAYGGFIPNPVVEGNPQQIVNDIVALTSLNFMTSQIILSSLRSDTVQAMIGNTSRYTPKKTPAVKL